MAYDEDLAARVREIVTEKADPVERKMFGGVAFMVGGHMCVGVIKEDLVLRLGDEGAEEALGDPHVRPMDFTGKPMKNFLYVDADGTKKEKDLRAWIDRGLAYVASLPPKPAKTKKKR
jgi:TfoX/Sxy family transcriptional regulator of competence genes